MESKTKTKRCKLKRLLHSFGHDYSLQIGQEVYAHWLSWMCNSKKSAESVYEIYEICDCGNCPYYVSYGPIINICDMPCVDLLYQKKPENFCQVGGDMYVDFSTVNKLIDYIENDPDIIEEQQYTIFQFLHHYEITEEDQTTLEYYLEASKCLYDKFGEHVYITKFDPKGWCITFA